MPRRAVLAVAMTLLALLPAAAQQTVVTRVSGTVSAQNYRALASFLQDRFDNVVALAVDFPAGGTYADGLLLAEKEGDIFVAYVPGPDNDTQISATNGFVEDGGRFVFDRFYKITYGGMGQGIVSIHVEPTLPPPGLPVTNVAIDDLPAAAN